MQVTLPQELEKQVEQEVASGHNASPNQFVEEAVRALLYERQRGERRLASLRRIGQAVDDAGLYGHALMPEE